MTTKEYLSQAFYLDAEISTELEMMESMHALATKATSTYSKIPPSGTRNVHRFEDTLAKIVDLDREIDEKVDKLVDLKREIVLVINEVENKKYRSLLGMRYLGFKSWEKIATELETTLRNVYRMHKRALASVKIPEKYQ